MHEVGISTILVLFASNFLGRTGQGIDRDGKVLIIRRIHGLLSALHLLACNVTDDVIQKPREVAYANEFRKHTQTNHKFAADKIQELQGKFLHKDLTNLSIAKSKEKRKKERMK
jgi:hypothetical protein